MCQLCQELGSFKTDKAKIGTVVAAMQKYGEAAVMAAGEAIAKSHVTKFEGSVLQKWESDPGSRAARLKEAATALSKDTKPYYKNVQELVFAPLWKAVSAAIST